MIHPVVLSGGAGTRLWPMSRTLRPKQLLPLAAETTLLQDTVRRVQGPGLAPPVVVCNEEHRFQVAEQLRRIGVAPGAILLEPAARNTAPAILAAAAWLEARDPDGILMVLPSDHHIVDVPAFHAALETGAQAATAGTLVTFGIEPTAPETGYGYIRRGAPLDGIAGVFAIDRFVEKPDLATAEAYLASGDYLWNSGMFLFPVAALLAEMSALEPAMVAGCRAAVAEARQDLDFLRLAAAPFAAVTSVSIDYALMERTRRGAIVPANLGWSDVGSWSALWAMADRDEGDNALIGDVVAADVAGCYIRADQNMVAALGVRDLVIIATDDVVLVVPRDRAQEVRDLVRQVEEAGRSEHYIHSKVFRPWGWYQSIDQGERFRVKQIVVNPGHKLSLQMHHHRAEHWVVVSGTARVTRGNETFYLTEDESTYIPHNTPHCLENPGRIPLRMIEVQSGGYLNEDDIIRFEDPYGRAAGSSAVADVK